MCDTMCKHTLNPLSPSLLIARPRLIMMLGITTSSKYTKDGASSACRDIRDIQIVYTIYLPFLSTFLSSPFLSTFRCNNSTSVLGPSLHLMCAQSRCEVSSGGIRQLHKHIMGHRARAMDQPDLHIISTSL